MKKPNRVAIIGAGMAGLACAQRLRASGHDVCLFDKGRGPGGRMSTRRVTIGESEVGFDHGAQYFTARDREFRAQVKTWQKDGLVAHWPDAGEGAWVGTPAMNAPISVMAASLPVRFSSRVDRVVREGTAWRLVGENVEPDRFGTIIIAVPAEQVPALVVDHCPGFAIAAKATPSKPCWTVMAAFSEVLSTEGNVFRSDGDIVWAARNSSKPGRTPMETWVIQAAPKWSHQHTGAAPAEVSTELLKAFGRQIGQDLPLPVFVQAHSWLYARSGSNGYGYLWDRVIGLGVCGDWLVGPRVECAWLSGNALAKTITRPAPSLPST